MLGMAQFWRGFESDEEPKLLEIKNGNRIVVICLFNFDG